MEKGFLFVCALLCLLAAPSLSATNDIDAALSTDSDNDGATDWDEWQAGTNPDDPSNVFEVTSFRLQDGRAVVTWSAVSSSAYEVVAARSPAGFSTNEGPAHIIVPTGGTGPWYQVAASITNQAGSTGTFFRVELRPRQDFETAVFDLATFE